MRIWVLLIMAALVLFFLKFLYLRKTRHTEASQVAQMIKHLPAVWETWVPSLGQEDPPEKEMATRSSTVAWKILWTEEPGGLQSMWSQRVRHDFTFTSLHT